MWERMRDITPSHQQNFKIWSSSPEELRSSRLGQTARVLAQVLDRLHGVLQIREKDQDVTRGQPVMKYFQGAVPKNQGGGQRHDDIDTSLEAGLQPLTSHIFFLAPGIMAVKPVGEFLLKRQCLHGPDSGNRFGGCRRNGAFLCPSSGGCTGASR